MKICKKHLDKPAHPEEGCLHCEIDMLRMELQFMTLRVIRLENEKNVCYPKKYVDSTLDRE